MNNKLTVTNAIFQEKDNELILSLEQGYNTASIKPMEQMLVDSDHLAFVYILEVNDDYTYLILPEHLWRYLRDANQANAIVKLTNGNSELILPAFHDELSYLVENISGNSNYGEHMVEKVESIFQEMVQK